MLSQRDLDLIDIESTEWLARLEEEFEIAMLGDRRIPQPEGLEDGERSLYDSEAAGDDLGSVPPSASPIQ